MSAKHIVVLTGAGISACSGVDTFRDPDGVWSKFDMNEVCTPEGYQRNPGLVHEFYNGRRAGLANVEPNAAHTALVALEHHLSENNGSLFVITQNVDDLHGRAGSKNLLHMHGELTRASCTACEEKFDWQGDISTETSCPACSTNGTVRPDIVWFGEMPYGLDRIERAIMKADMFVSIGTSGAVYPAAGLVAEARRLDIPCVELNLEPSDNARLFTQSLYGKASEIVPAWVDEIITGS